MGKTIEPLRGVHDVLPSQAAVWQHLERVTREVFAGHLRTRLSAGGLVDLWRRAGGVFLPWYEEIGEQAFETAVGELLVHLAEIVVVLRTPRIDVEDAKAPLVLARRHLAVVDIWADAVKDLSKPQAHDFRRNLLRRDGELLVEAFRRQAERDGILGPAGALGAGLAAEEIAIRLKHFPEE